jgi:hypothetical protein
MDKLWINKNVGSEGNADFVRLSLLSVLPEGYKWITYSENNINVKIIREFSNKQIAGIMYRDEHILYYFREGAIFKGITKDGSLIGLISIKPSKMSIKTAMGDSVEEVSEINFLSIEREYRGKGIINFLVKEVIRISINKGITRGIYTSSDRHPNLIKECHNYHYLSNVKKLLDVGFIEEEIEIGIEELENILKIDKSIYKINRRMELTEDIIEKLNKFVKKFDISKEYGIKSGGGDNISDTELYEYYTTEDENGEVKGLLVLYKLDFMSPEATTDNRTKSALPLATQVLTPEATIIKNAIIYTYYHDEDIKVNEFLKSCLKGIKHFDCISCLDIMDMSVELLNELRMREGSSINYYMFELDTPDLKSYPHFGVKIGNSNF